MFEIGLSVLGPYTLALYIGELLFRRRRLPSRSERLWRMLETGALVLALGAIVFIEYGRDTKLFYSVPAAAAALLLLRNTYEYAKHGSSGEHLNHAVVCLLTPGMLALAMVIWNFIDGAGVFLGAMLPFSMKNLRPLMSGYLAAVSVLLLYQVKSWHSSRRHHAVPTAQAADAASPQQQAEVPISNGAGHENEKVAS